MLLIACAVISSRSSPSMAGEGSTAVTCATCGAIASVCLPVPAPASIIVLLSVTAPSTRARIGSCGVLACVAALYDVARLLQ